MITIENKLLTNYTFIDLFAGLGGFRIALESLGAKCVYSNEWDVTVQKVYAENFGENANQAYKQFGNTVVIDVVQLIAQEIGIVMRRK